MKRRTAAATLIALFAIGAQAKADDDRAALAQEQMQQALERLELTDDRNACAAQGKGPVCLRHGLLSALWRMD